MTLEDLTQATMMDVPEAPIMTVRDMLHWATGELCRDGNAWVEEGDIALVSGDSAELQSPSGATPVRVLSLSTPAGVTYTQTGPSSLAMSHNLSASTLSGCLAVTPSDSSPLPDDVIEDHAETLRHGALWRLLMLPQPWRDPETAMYHNTRWTAGVNDAKRSSWYGRQAGKTRAKPRRFI